MHGLQRYPLSAPLRITIFKQRISERGNFFSYTGRLFSHVSELITAVCHVSTCVHVCPDGASGPRPLSFCGAHSGRGCCSLTRDAQLASHFATLGLDGAAAQPCADIVKKILCSVSPQSSPPPASTRLLKNDRVSVTVSCILITGPQAQYPSHWFLVLQSYILAPPKRLQVSILNQ